MTYISTNKTVISVVGLGYVGLPLALALSKHFRVIAFDIDSKRIKELQSGFDKNNEFLNIDTQNQNIQFTYNDQEIVNASLHIIAVPTPVNEAKTPDFHPLQHASAIVGNRLKTGDMVVYESTVYPGATEEICIPILEQASKLTSPRDFVVGYSPERINPGDRAHSLEKIIKVVSAQNEHGLNKIEEIYKHIIDAGIHKAKSIKIAEAAKIIENTQRDINIALMNEFSIILNLMGVESYEVLEAAKTKWNFLPFTPGLVGGHCIGVDPYYLTHKAQMLGYTPQIILAGRKINDEMNIYVAHQLMKQMAKSSIALSDANITILGATFKENVSDIRNSGVSSIFKELKSFGLNVSIYDPLVPLELLNELYGPSAKKFSELAPTNVVLLAVPHTAFLELKIPELLFPGGVLFDVKSALKDRTFSNINYVCI